MPVRSAQRLEQLCIQAIVGRWDDVIRVYFGESEELHPKCNFSPFQCLPEFLLHEIEEQLLFLQPKLLRLQDFMLLVGRPVTQLNLKPFFLSKADALHAMECLTNWTPYVQDLVFGNGFIKYCWNRQQICKATLKYQLSAHTTAFDLLLRTLNNVTRLSFEATQCQNWMLKIVARHCPRLQELNVTDCPNVSDSGILAFCQATNRSTTSTFDQAKPNKDVNSNVQLALTKVWLAGTSVSKETVAQLLLHFSSLRLLHHPDFLEAFTLIYGNGYDSCLGQRQQDMLSDIICDRSWLYHLQEPSGLLSFITRLKLTGLTSDLDFSFLHGLTNLKELTLICDPYSHSCGFNLSALAIYCPQLQHLSLQMKGPLKFTFPLPDNAFRNIETLDVDRAGSDTLSATNALKLLTRCTQLTRLSLLCCPWLTDKILDDLLRLNPLQHTRHMTLHDTKLSVDGLCRLLSLRNNLRVLYVGSYLIGSHHQKFFGDYVRRKNWDLDFKLNTSLSFDFIDYE